MTGWTIFRIAVLWLADSLPAALRVSVLPYGATVAFDLWVRSTWPGLTFSPGVPMPAGFAAATFVSLAGTLAASVWISIAWHRHLLLATPVTGWVPQVPGPLVGGYIFRLMGLGLIAMAAVLIVGIVTAPFAVLFGIAGVMTLSQLAGVFVATLLSLRFGLILPAFTVERPLEFGEAWAAGAGKLPDLLILTALTIAVSLGFGQAVLLDGGATAITPLYDAVTGWISLLLGTTVLTVLYGHLIEGHTLD